MQAALPLRTDVDTPLEDCVRAVGVDFTLATNYRPALEAVLASFPRSEAGLTRSKLRVQFAVDPGARGGADWTKPYMRGLGHLVVVEFDEENSLLTDLRRRRALGGFTPASATDRAFWQRMIFPLLLGVAGATVGITALHCACVVRDGKGLLLTGESGAGKSTLALALARRGFTYVSDEWTYLSLSEGGLLAWGLPTPLKLLPDAVAFFPELAAISAAEALNGELAFEVDPQKVFGVRREHCCEPHRLVLLDRRPGNEHSFEAVNPEEAWAHLEMGLLPEEPSAMRAQRVALAALVARPCARFRYGGNLQAAAEAIERYCELGSAPAGGR